MAEPHMHPVSNLRHAWRDLACGTATFHRLPALIISCRPMFL